MAKDKYHDHVRKALENDGWRITHDPYWINIEGTNYPVDLGGEEVIGAEKGGKKIAVEIKKSKVSLRKAWSTNFTRSWGSISTTTAE